MMERFIHPRTKKMVELTDAQMIQVNQLILKGHTFVDAVDYLISGHDKTLNRWL